MEIIGVIVAGIIIGLLGKFVAPGDRDNIPIWLTILCGIGGVLIGWFVYTAFGGNGSPGIDWVRWLDRDRGRRRPGRDRLHPDRSQPIAGPLKARPPGRSPVPRWATAAVGYAVTAAVFRRERGTPTLTER